jgi:hypothetical protein
MAPYPYSPLDPGERNIRLLRILRRGWGTEDVYCEFIDSLSDKDKGIPYKALSYTWGVDPQRTPVFVDDHPVDVTENLHSALQHIRQRGEDVVLWVDAICINQQDAQEKGHQVKQMKYIYTNAEQVLIWLGPADDDIDILLQSIRDIDNEANEAQARGFQSGQDRTSLCRKAMSHALEAHRRPRAKKALEELVARPWFKRVWVLQEVANARTARILCGSTSCPARTFALMPSLMKLRVSKHIQAVLDIMPRVRGNTWWSSTRSLHFLLAKFVDSEASCTRDKVYALLGMSEDACDPKIFYPSYEKEDVDVFRDTASFLLFGEILDETHSFPYVSSPGSSPGSFVLYLPSAFRNLYLPIPQLAALTLRWILEETRHEEVDTFESSWGYQRRSEGLHKTAELLVSRMNDGRLKTDYVLLSLAARHVQANVNRVRYLPLQGSFKPRARLDYGSDGNKVRYMLSQGSVKLRVRLDYGSGGSANGLVFARPGSLVGTEVPIVVVVPHGVSFPTAVSRRVPGVSRRVHTGIYFGWF